MKGAPAFMDKVISAEDKSHNSGLTEDEKDRLISFLLNVIYSMGLENDKTLEAAACNEYWGSDVMILKILAEPAGDEYREGESFYINIALEAAIELSAIKVKAIWREAKKAVEKLGLALPPPEELLSRKTLLLDRENKQASLEL